MWREGGLGSGCGYFAHVPLSSLEIGQPGKPGTHDERLEDGSPM